MKIDKEKLRRDYTQACNAYLHAFADKHEMDREDCRWVAEEPGGIAEIGDYYVGMDVITTDIEMDAPEEEFLKWYDYSLRCDELGLPDKCNYSSWLRGCPRYSDEAFERIAALRKIVEESGERLKRAIREESEGFGQI